MKKSFDPRSFLIGVLVMACLAIFLGAGSDEFSPDETSKLKSLAGRLTPDGDLDMGTGKIIMQGSTIYDDSSEGGGLILRGGSGRVSVFGLSMFRDGVDVVGGSLHLNSDLDMGTKKIIMQGSSIYDDSSEGGGLILRGGSGRINLFGQTQQH
ncbi:MAG: hypothetical protein V1816_09770 [Pseudomonadota bacterium]